MVDHHQSDSGDHASRVDAVVSALRGALERTLAGLMRQLARHAIHLHPFMPTKSTELWHQLGAPGVLAHQRFANVATLDVSGWQVTKGSGLFPKENATTTT